MTTARFRFPNPNLPSPKARAQLQPDNPARASFFSYVPCRKEITITHDHTTTTYDWEREGKFSKNGISSDSISIVYRHTCGRSTPFFSSLIVFFYYREDHAAMTHSYTIHTYHSYITQPDANQSTKPTAGAGADGPSSYQPPPPNFIFTPPFFSLSSCLLSRERELGDQCILHTGVLLYFSILNGVYTRR